MKKLVLVSAFLIGLSTVSFAQGRQQRTPDETVAALKTSIAGITDDQAAKIKAIYVANAAGQDSIVKAANGDRQAARPKTMALRTATSAKVKALLTVDQQKQWDALPQNQPRN